LVSNAVDASQKLKFFSSNGEFKGELGDLQVEVILDKKKKTITIKDNGIGMTADEIDKYINQIAFSGAEEFVKKIRRKRRSGTNYRSLWTWILFCIYGGR
jgi:molecular chaperone HtpG